MPATANSKAAAEREYLDPVAEAGERLHEAEEHLRQAERRVGEFRLRYFGRSGEPFFDADALRCEQFQVEKELAGEQRAFQEAFEAWRQAREVLAV